MRPASVPEQASYFGLNNSFCVDAHWQMRETAGTLVMWDLDGDLMSKCKYDKSNRIQDEYSYSFGNLRSRTVNRKQGKDRELTIFDKTGQPLYTVRDEWVTDTHRRRYYNNILVYEKEADRINYFYPNGNILIDYTANYWQLYDEQGRVALKMPENNARTPWDVFLPTWAAYDEEQRHISYWDVITTNFRKKYNDVQIDNKIAALEVPALLQAGFDKTDLDSSLLIYFSGLLSNDEEVVNVCSGRIWAEMNYQEMAFGLKVGILLARLLPYYINEPVIGQRLYTFLYGVAALPNIKGMYELYAELLASLQPLLPLFFEWAAGPDDERARKAQYLLIIAAKEQPATEALLLAEWQNTSHTRVRRSYALFTLGSWYAFNEEAKKMIATFSPALLTETDALIRLILAVYLVAATNKEADERWLAVLVTTLTDAAEIRDDFDTMKPFRGESILEEYVLALLYDKAPEVLDKNITSIIAQLPAINHLKHSPLFEAICTMLLSNGRMENIEPLTKKILLAIADMVEKAPDFIAKEKNWFKNYNIPTHVAHIRDLAASNDK